MSTSDSVSLNPQPIPPNELARRLRSLGVIPLPGPPFDVITEEFDICCVGHNFFPLPSDVLHPSEPMRYVVQDYLLDQSRRTGAGAAMVERTQADFTASVGYAFQLRASCGKAFHVKPPVGVAAVSFVAYLGRQAVSPTSDVFDLHSATVTFDILTGAPPRLDYATLGISKVTNTELLFTTYGQLTAACSFSKLTINGSYPARAHDPGVKWYKPLSYADPLGPLSTGESPTFVMFSYITENPSDPGRFVAIE